MLNFLQGLWPGAQRAETTHLPAHVPATAAEFADPLPDICRQVTGKRRENVPQVKGQTGALTLALLAAGKPCSVTELATLMGVSISESSRRVKAAGKRVKCRRVGKYKMVSLAALTMSEAGSIGAAERRARR